MGMQIFKKKGAGWPGIPWESLPKKYWVSQVCAPSEKKRILQLSRSNLCALQLSVQCGIDPRGFFLSFLSVSYQLGS